MTSRSASETRFLEFVRTWAPAVEEALSRWLPEESREPEVLHRAMRYSVLSEGKRFRPLLVLASAEASGLQPHRAMRAACAVEVIHTYSLIHDDLPSMDDAATRRGRPTCHVVFGEAIATLAGDALHALAFTWLGGLTEEGIEPSRVVRAVREVADAIGTEGMVGGQVLDLLAERGLVSAEQVSEIHRRKTGALIRACARLGPVLAGRDDLLPVLDTYGGRLGLAFQIADDILDASAEAGLPKVTYPKVYGIEASRRMARAEMEVAISALDPLGEAAEVLRGLARFAVERAW